MKKILSLLLVGVMVVSMIPTAFATTNYTNGTQVEYDAADDDTIGDSNNDGSPDNVEYYTVTVPAKLAPAGSGDVVAQGTWASNRKLVVTADKDVTLTNSISGADEKVLTVTFPGIELPGCNTAAVSDTKVVSVANISAALFGEWTGLFEYNVEMVNNVELITFTIGDYGYDNEYTEGEEALKLYTLQAEKGMTWAEWVNSEYNTINAELYEIHRDQDCPTGINLLDDGCVLGYLMERRRPACCEEITDEAYRFDWT